MDARARPLVIEIPQRGAIEMIRRLKQILATNSDLIEAKVTEVWFLAARALAFLTLLLLAAMPFTEHFWTFDNFCHGGQDFEFSLLAIAIALGLVLLISLDRKRGLALVLFTQQWLSLLLRAADSRVEGATRMLIDRSAGLEHSFAPSKFEIPLLI